MFHNIQGTFPVKVERRLENRQRFTEQSASNEFVFGSLKTLNIGSEAKVKVSAKNVLNLRAKQQIRFPLIMRRVQGSASQQLQSMSRLLHLVT